MNQTLNQPREDIFVMFKRHDRILNFYSKTLDKLRAIVGKDCTLAQVKRYQRLINRQSQSLRHINADLDARMALNKVETAVIRSEIRSHG